MKSICFVGCISGICGLVACGAQPHASQEIRISGEVPGWTIVAHDGQDPDSNEEWIDIVVDGDATSGPPLLRAVQSAFNSSTWRDSPDHHVVVRAFADECARRGQFAIANLNRTGEDPPSWRYFAEPRVPLATHEQWCMAADMQAFRIASPQMMDAAHGDWVEAFAAANVVSFADAEAAWKAATRVYLQ